MIFVKAARGWAVHGPTYKQIFFNKYYKCTFPYNFLFSMFIVRIQYIIYIPCVNQLFILLVRLRLLVNSRLLVVKFGGVESYTWIFDYTEC